MLKHSVTTTFAALASVATSLLLVAAAPSLARAAELKLLSPFSFRALLPRSPTAIREVIGAHGYGQIRHARRHHRTLSQGRGRRRRGRLAHTNRGTAEAGQAAYGQWRGDCQGRLRRLREDGRIQARSRLSGCTETQTADSKVHRLRRSCRRRRKRRLPGRLDATLGTFGRHKGEDQVFSVRDRGGRVGGERRIQRSKSGWRAMRRLFQVSTPSRCRPRRRAILCMWPGSVRTARSLMRPRH